MWTALCLAVSHLLCLGVDNRLEDQTSRRLAVQDTRTAGRRGSAGGEGEFWCLLKGDHLCVREERPGGSGWGWPKMGQGVDGAASAGGILPLGRHLGPSPSSSQVIRLAPPLPYCP